MTVEDEDKKKDYKINRHDVMRFAFHYWRPRKWLGIASASLMFLSVAMDAIAPIFTGKLVDAMTKLNADDVGAVDMAWAAFYGFFAVALLHQLFRIASVYYLNKFAVGNLYAIVTDGLRKVQSFSADWHANAFAGGTVRKITRGMWAFDQFEDTILFGLLPPVVIVVGMVASLSYTMPMVGALTALMVFVFVTFSIYISIKVLAPRFAASAKEDTKMGATLADIVTGNPTVKSFGAEEKENNLFAGVATVWRDKSYHAWLTAIYADAARTVLRLGLMVTMLTSTIYLWSQGQATPGNITQVITSYFIIGGYLRDVGQQISNLQRSINDMEDVVGFWLRVDNVQNTGDAKPLSIDKNCEDVIVFDNVSFAYPSQNKLIYQNMHLKIKAGERVALVGASGSGKSTFVKLIQRLYDVTDGEIRIYNQNIAKVTMESLRQSVALVPQDPVLFHRSLSENIAYAKENISTEVIEEAAKKSFAHDFVLALPKAYDTLVGERGVKLSGGERQRVAIARAIVADAPILILDEATSSLDSISEHYIQKALEHLMEGRTTITIAHRLSTIQRADRILVFEQGKIIEQGTHADLMRNPNSRYKALYDMQALDLIGDR